MSFQVEYLVCLSDSFLQDKSPIAMVDGTVPGFTQGYWDIYYDHHRLGGGKVQIDEMPFPKKGISHLEKQSEVMAIGWGDRPIVWTIVTTMVDADACVAAAWLQLKGEEISDEVRDRLRAIALDCDYLCIPPDEEEYQHLADFAAKAVAAMKQCSSGVWKELDLPENKREWSEEQKVLHDSVCFKRGTEWLLDAARGIRPWPGESGEADEYFRKLEAQKEEIWDLVYLRKIRRKWRWPKDLSCESFCVIYFEQPFDGYIDPRVPLAVGKEKAEKEGLILEPITLSARPMRAMYGDQEVVGRRYTLGTVPHLAGRINLSNVFPELWQAEAARREELGLPPAQTNWGGRAAVGGSGQRDPSLLDPGEVIAIAAKFIS